MPVKIIGLTGSAGSGKDTTANYIQQHVPGVHIRAFAGPLKEACKILFKLSNKQLYNLKEKEKPIARFNNMSPRQLMQFLGTDCLRKHISDTIFIDMMSAEHDELSVINDNSSDNSYMIITDMRFNNEAEWVKERGGLVVKIERNGVRTEHSEHASEQGISKDLIDHVLENHGTLDDFYELLYTFIRAVVI